MGDLIVAGRVKAVQYVRASTEHQKYSIENQSIAIAEYARSQGYDIVGTYADEGLSGLTADRRPALQKLLHDVTSPNRHFSVVLVLDVSRFGRFQDVDQHAAYEFLCREMGVRIEYAREIFPNDDSLATSLLKHVKRVMAGEFSRELSMKVSAAANNCASKGFKQGGRLVYGFRRLIVDADGTPKKIAGDYEWKYLSSDRVVIVPGPEEEIEVARRIFRMFTVELRTRVEISRILNEDGVTATNGKPWTANQVYGVLSSSLYIGVYSYGKISWKLKRQRIRNPETLWVKTRIGGPLIDPEMFETAQAMLKRHENHTAYSKPDMLKGLAELLKTQGTLSGTIIDASFTVPSAATYAKHFGGLGGAYAAVGYAPQGRQKGVLEGTTRSRGTWTTDKMLDALRRLLAEQGRLSANLLLNCPYTPSPTTYALRFGSLPDAYAQIGYLPDRPSPSKKRRSSGKTPSAETAIRGLKALYEREGYINRSLICCDPALPSAGWYRTTFGSVEKAYALAGLGERPHAFGNARRNHVRDVFAGVTSQDHKPFSTRHRDMSDDDIIAGIKRISERFGYVSGRLINEDPTLPRSETLYRRFGTLRALYAKAEVIGKSKPGPMRSWFKGHKETLSPQLFDTGGISPP